jgi:plastocyanin
MLSKPFLRAALLSILFPLGLACSSSTSEGMGGSGAVGDVVIKLNASTLGAGAFNPGTFTVSFAMQQRVVWSNRDRTSSTYGSSGVTHHLVSDGGVFDSGSLNPGNNFGFTFATAGTYPYHCSIHPTMVGTIVLNP